MRRTALLALAAASLAAAQPGQETVAPPPRPKKAAATGLKSAPHRVVRVSPADAINPAEVAVAINPTHRDHVVVSSFQGRRPDRGGRENFTYTTFDAGRSWKAVACPNPDRRNQGDDAVAFGPDGTVYHCYLSALGYQPQHTRAASGLFVRRSLDALTWEPPVPVVDHVNTAEPMEDKPWVAVDGVPGSPHRGNVYVAWTRFDKYGSKDPEHRSRIHLARSRDGGKTFAPPVRVSDKSGNALDDSGTLEGAVPAVGPKGVVYVAWAGPDGILCDRSDDGGFSFGPDVKVAEQPGGWAYDAAGLERHNGLPVTGCDTTRGKFAGSVYVCWADRRHGDSDVFVAASRDGGKTWGPPVRVNDDPAKNGRDQLFPWMAVDPADGSVNIVFFDRRAGAAPADPTTAVTVARSVDGGQTFANFAVGMDPFRTDRRTFVGDYIGIAADRGRVVAAFPHVAARRQLAVSAAFFRFRPGTLDVLPDE